ncbi:MAG TPA: 3-phosphoserine/phosphohydroxythreonine transaminase [Rectinema sp.]|nr:3-phosphoserine/phosphohydroxythreonine transaminase [Rectinema sp.]HQH88258.1 3-phosphoserine/phosphohydroxythreonine transaminase [Rectinema sp.]
MKRVINFNAGPAALPMEVLQKAQEEMLDWQSTGMSVMEVSHRSSEYEAMHNESQELFRKLAGMGPEWKILFMTGGASTQFFMVPMNYLFGKRKATYVVTGHWSKAAKREAQHFGSVDVISTENKDGSFTRIPKQEELKIDSSSTYVHMTSNNTIYGSQWQYWPELEGVPLVCDMSSDIFSRPFPVDKLALIYAGAQKNLGPSGVTVVAIREDFLDIAREGSKLPTMLSYRTFSENNSLYNTPPCFSIYILNLMLKWLLYRIGGLQKMQEINEEKARILYEAIDLSDNFYRGPVEKGSRSQMNVVFRLKTPEMEDTFIEKARSAGIVGVRGHRSTGGIRFSIYNANLVDNVRKAAEFMEEFQRINR